jgi:hypothetical protein
MEIEELKGLVIFTGVCAFFAFILTGLMGRSIARIDELIDEDKYVN